MEPDLLKLMMGLGPYGAGLAVLWVIAKRFIDAHQAQVSVTQAEMTKRIDALERGHQECEVERQKLGGMLIDALTARATEKSVERHERKIAKGEAG